MSRAWLLCVVALACEKRAEPVVQPTPKTDRCPPGFTLLRGGSVPGADWLPFDEGAFSIDAFGDVCTREAPFSGVSAGYSVAQLGVQRLYVGLLPDGATWAVTKLPVAAALGRAQAYGALLRKLGAPQDCHAGALNSFRASWGGVGTFPEAIASCTPGSGAKVESRALLLPMHLIIAKVIAPRGKPVDATRFLQSLKAGRDVPMEQSRVFEGELPVGEIKP